MRKTYWFVALAIIALGVAAYPRAPQLATRGDQGGVDAELTRVKAELADETAARKRDVAALEAQLRAFANRAAPAGQAPPADATAAAPTEPEEAEQRPEPVDPGEHLASAFAAQTRDASWAARAEDSLQQKLRAALPGATLQSIECHASMCRLETVHADASAFGQFVSDAFKDPSKRIWEGNAFTEEPVADARGQMVVVSYLAREGESFPQVR